MFNFIWLFETQINTVIITNSASSSSILERHHFLFSVLSPLDSVLLLWTVIFVATLVSEQRTVQKAGQKALFK